jgi:hypothetical protein
MCWSCLRLRGRISRRQANGEHVREDWLRLLSQDEIRSVEFGVAARKLVEFVVTSLGVTKGALAQRIRELETLGRVAPWLCAYMHVLRQLGNEAAHESGAGSGRIPAVLSPADLTAGLFCVQRLLDAWPELMVSDHPPTNSSIPSSTRARPNSNASSAFQLPP